MKIPKLRNCPHCQREVELLSVQSGFSIICTDHNCLGGMSIHYGWADDPELFLRKLISNWNRRTPDVPAIDAAVKCIEEYRSDLYDSCQEPYDEHGQCCIEVADEIINRLRCFSCQEAVDAWSEKEDG